MIVMIVRLQQVFCCGLFIWRGGVNSVAECRCTEKKSVENNINILKEMKTELETYKSKITDIEECVEEVACNEENAFETSNKETLLGAIRKTDDYLMSNYSELFTCITNTITDLEDQYTALANEDDEYHAEDYIKKKSEEITAYQRQLLGY